MHISEGQNTKNCAAADSEIWGLKFSFCITIFVAPSFVLVSLSFTQMFFICQTSSLCSGANHQVGLNEC